MFGKFNKSVVISSEKVTEAVRAFNELGIGEYEFAELGLGETGIFCVAFKANKKQFVKFLDKVRVNYIAVR